MWMSQIKKIKRVPPAPVPLVAGGQEPPSQTQEDVPPQWLARFECLQKGLQDVQYQIAKRTPLEEQQGVPFGEEIMAVDLPLNWKEPNLPEYNGTTDLQEHLSYFENIALPPPLHHWGQVSCVRKHLQTVGPIVVQSIAIGIHPII
ncbi:UNVERIFIED_CONTAM: hypothetical protein Slati_4516900 [Sesamum latifolium]|uniref:Uncharacterized protein n=1 Tax=Sesamum latifolium TaxID=2727402 RepID=A0AAW2SST3_9LAMI